MLLFMEKKDKLGTLVFKDNESKEILTWKHIESGLVKDYKYLKEELIAHGYGYTNLECYFGWVERLV